MNRARVLAAMVCLIGAGVPTVAATQNLEAGKSPGQIFSNTCNACHRSPRGLLRTVPPGSLPGFLREHYTTSREMAQQLSGFLIANGATDTRGRPQDVRQQPAGTDPQQQQARAPRQAEPQQQPQQQQAARPTEAEQRPLTRRERRERRAKGLPDMPAAAAAVIRESADGRQKNRRSRITPARIEAASERGKDALPLGAVATPPAAEPMKQEGVASPPEPSAEAAKPIEKPLPASETATRADPVPQVTPASPRESTAPIGNATAGPSNDVAPSEAGRSTSDDQPSGGIAPPEPAESPPSAQSPPPRPPISQ